MVRMILIGAVGLAVILALLIGRRPSTFYIERSITMAARPEAAFARVNDFRQWGAWSPWEKMDPGMQRTFSGAPSGPGAVYAWAGNQNVGEGRMTIVDVNAPARITIKLEFLKPFAATNTATFTFAPTAGGTTVTWAMDGKNTFMGKAVSLVMDMDKMIGGNFENGLAALKAGAESDPAARQRTARAVN